MEECVPSVSINGFIIIILYLPARFYYPLPGNVLPEGQHRVLKDPTERYYGINLQKKVEFKKQTLVKSNRTKELELEEQLIGEQMDRLAKSHLDKKARKEAAERMLEDIRKEEEQEALKNQEDGTEAQNEGNA